MEIIIIIIRTYKKMSGKTLLGEINYLTFIVFEDANDKIEFRSREAFLEKMPQGQNGWLVKVDKEK